MAGPLLLVALPPSGVTLVTLRGGQSIHPEPLEDSPHPRRADIDVVVALEVHPDLQRAEVVMLAQVDDLLDDVGMGDRRAVQRSAGAVLEALQALVFVSALPPVEDVAADAVVAAGGGDVSADLLRMLQHRQAPIRPPDQILLTPHTISHAAPFTRSPDCQQPQSVLDLERCSRGAFPSSVTHELFIGNDYVATGISQFSTEG